MVCPLDRSVDRRAGDGEQFGKLSARMGPRPCAERRGGKLKGKVDSGIDTAHDAVEDVKDKAEDAVEDVKDKIDRN